MNRLKKRSFTGEARRKKVAKKHLERMVGTKIYLSYFPMFYNELFILMDDLSILMSAIGKP